MKKSNKEEPNIMCIAYLSAEGDLYRAQEKENKQLRYLRQYAKANHVDICLVARRDGMGQMRVNKQWKTMVELIEKGKADGILIANTEAVSSSVADSFLKVGQVYEAGGIVVSVDEGRLTLPVKRMIDGRMVLVNERY